MKYTSKELHNLTSKAVSIFWKTRKAQAKKQKSKGTKDQGSRGSVTGGAQLDGFAQLLTRLIISSGINKKCIFHHKQLQLPGFFRAEKQWDIIVIKDKQLILAIEMKSQVGSFGNNLNNRAEEALGNAIDLWTAYRKGAINKTVKPWIGYVYLMEDCPKSQKPVKVREPHFKVLPEFKKASYVKRCELLCRKLVRERHYNSAAFIISNEKKGLKGNYSEPAADLSFEMLTRSMFGHASAFGALGARK